MRLWHSGSSLRGRLRIINARDHFELSAYKSYRFDVDGCHWRKNVEVTIRTFRIASVPFCCCCQNAIVIQLKTCRVCPVGLRSQKAFVWNRQLICCLCVDQRYAALSIIAVDLYVASNNFRDMRQLVTGSVGRWVQAAFEQVGYTCTGRGYLFGLLFEPSELAPLPEPMSRRLNAFRNSVLNIV